MSLRDEVKSVGLPYKAEADSAVNARDLEEFHERHARDTWWARVTLITLIFGMIALNLWMSERSYDSMIIDVDASRQAASEIDEQTDLRFDAVDKQLDRIEARLDAAAAATTPAAPAAAPAPAVVASAAKGPAKNAAHR